MKWFLQFLSLGSVILYTLLVIIDYRISDGIADKYRRQRSSIQSVPIECVGPYLLNRSPGHRGARGELGAVVVQRVVLLARRGAHAGPRADRCRHRINGAGRRPLEMVHGLSRSRRE